MKLSRLIAVATFAVAAGFSFSAGAAVTTLAQAKIDMRLGHYTEAASRLQSIEATAHPEVLFWLGSLYKNGRGVERDLVRACDLFQRSAEQGFASAQNSYGLCLRKGSLGSIQPIHALAWFEEAAENGSQTAKENARRLRMSLSPSRLGGLIGYRTKIDTAIRENRLSRTEQARLAMAAYDGLSASPYLIQVGLFTRAGSGNAVREALVRNGYDVSVDQIPFRGKQADRIRVIGYETRDAASDASKEIDQLLMVESLVVKSTKKL